MCFKFIDFENQNWEFQNLHEHQMVNTKVVVVDTIYKFVVDKFFIWDCLEYELFV
jgi:hypothetical protein